MIYDSVHEMGEDGGWVRRRKKNSLRKLTVFINDNFKILDFSSHRFNQHLISADITRRLQKASVIEIFTFRSTIKNCFGFKILVRGRLELLTQAQVKRTSHEIYGLATNGLLSRHLMSPEKNFAIRKQQ